MAGKEGWDAAQNETPGKTKRRESGTRYEQRGEGEEREGGISGGREEWAVCPVPATNLL